MIANHFYFYFSLLLASFSVLSSCYSFSSFHIPLALFVHLFCFDISHSFRFMLLCLVLFMNCLLHCALYYSDLCIGKRLNVIVSTIRLCSMQLEYLFYKMRLDYAHAINNTKPTEMANIKTIRPIETERMNPMQ